MVGSARPTVAGHGALDTKEPGFVADRAATLGACVPVTPVPPQPDRMKPRSALRPSATAGGPVPDPEPMARGRPIRAPCETHPPRPGRFRPTAKKARISGPFGVAGPRFELGTPRFSVVCSTN